MPKFIAIFLFIFFFSSNLVLAKNYDLNSRKKYYGTGEFQSEVSRYCNFDTSYVASYKIELDSMDEAEKLLKQVSDFQNKHKWNDDIDGNKSFALKNGNPHVGTVYHFEQTKVYSPLLPIPPTKNIYDYYVQEKTNRNFKGCVLYSSLPLQYANFEYQIVNKDGKTYIQRTARVVPKLVLPKAVIMQKLQESNKNSLKKAVTNILGKKS